MNIEDQDKEMAAGFGAALAMTKEAVSETLGQREERLTQEQRERVKAIWRNLRAEAIRSPEDEAMEFARRIRTEQGKQEPVAYLYTGRDTNKVHRQWASISNSDHWPVDQWETIRQELLYLATPDALLAAELRGMEKAAKICVTRGEAICDRNYYAGVASFQCDELIRAEIKRREGK